MGRLRKYTACAFCIAIASCVYMAVKMDENDSNKFLYIQIVIYVMMQFRYVLESVRSSLVSGDIYVHRFQGLFYLYLFTEQFHEDYSSIVRSVSSGDWREIFVKQFCK